MKKLLSLIILAAMLTATACADSGASTPDTTESSAAETAAETELSDNLPEADYEGYKFRMMLRNDAGWIEDMYAEASNGEVMNDAVYERNQKVAERFNVVFELIKSSNSNYETDGMKAITAGDDAYDIIIPHARAAFAYALQHYCLDWTDELPYVDLDMPWWDQSARESFSVANNLYMMIGDISYKNLGATNAMLFNKQLFDDLSLDYPYQAVYDGTWTFGAFTELAKTGTYDLNGDGKLLFEDDQTGYVTDEWIGPIQVLYSGDQRIVSKDEEDLPYISLNTPQTVDIFDKFFALIDSDYGHCANWEGLDTSVSSATGIYGRFANNQALFLDTNIRGVVFLRNMDANFGVLPWPKFDDTVDKYYSNVDAGCNLIIVPISASNNAELISVILEALGCEGYKSVVPAYYNVALATKYTRDDESTDMLELVRAGRVYDLGYYDNDLSVLNSIGEYMFVNKKRDFASVYAAAEKPAEKHLDKLIESYTG